MLALGLSCNRAVEPRALPALPQDATAAVEALRARLHGTLRDDLDRITVEIRDGGDSGPWRSIDIDRRRIRVVTPPNGARGKTVEVLLNDAGWRSADNPSAPAQTSTAQTTTPQASIPQAPTQLSSDECQALADLRDLVAAAYLVPLTGAKSIARRGPTVFAIEARDGSTWRFEIDAARQLPVSLSGPPGEVRFLTFLSTSASELPADVELGTLGRHHLRLIACGVLFEKSLFAEPASVASQRRLAQAVPAPTGEPAEPEVWPLAERPFLRIEDPGDWATRAARVLAAYATLTEQAQLEEGLPFLFEAENKAWIGIPFAPDADQGGPSFVARRDQVVQRRPQQFALVLYRGKQAFEASSLAGSNAVRAYATQTQSIVTGPLRVIPHLDWHRGEPSAAALAAVKLRFELPIEKPGK